jgi:anti-anti-sigma regulatory factor
MAIQYFSEDILLVRLPLGEPQISNELKEVNDFIGNEGNFDVIVDFSQAEMVISTSLTNLMILRQFLGEIGRRLVLCDVSIFVKNIFSIVGLEALFDFADDKFAALESLRRAKSHSQSCFAD